MPTWTGVSDPAEAALLPAWFVGRMMVGHGGSFGLLLTTGDVLRRTRTIAHLSSDGTVLLDHAGVPDGVDTAWRSEHCLGSSVPGGARVTVNLAHILAAVEFAASANAKPSTKRSAAAESSAAATVVKLRQAAENAVERRSLD